MAKNWGMLKGIIAMGFFVSWVNILPFYGPQLAMLGITGNFSPHIFTTLHIIGLMYGAIKYQKNPEELLLYTITRISPYILSILTIFALLPLARDNFYSVFIFTCLGFFSGISVSRWLSWFSSEVTKNRRNVIFGSALALTYILMSVTTITTNWLLNSLVLGLSISAILVLTGGLLINDLSIPPGRKVRVNYRSVLPSPWLILFALFAYSSISLLYDQIFDWGRQFFTLPFLLIIPYVFVGFILTRWVSSRNRLFFAIIAFFLVGFGFLLYLLDSTSSLVAIITSIFISTGLLCFHLYYWISLVESQDPDYAPITISLGVSFELAVFAAIYSIRPYLNFDLNRPGILIGIAGLIFVLLGMVIIALKANQLNPRLIDRSVYGSASDHISPLLKSNPRISVMTAALHLHDTNPKDIEDFLKDEFKLTDREVEVAYLLFLSYKNKDIQNKLCITVNTLKYHIRNIYSKLGVNNRDKAIELVYAMLIEHEQ